MNPHLQKGVLYLAFLLIVLAMCGCAGKNDRVNVVETEFYMSKTQEGVPVLITLEREILKRGVPSRDIIDTSLDRLIQQFTLEDLSKHCWETAVDLENYFFVSGLKLKLQSKYNKGGIWPDTERCPVTINKPKT